MRRDIEEDGGGAGMKKYVKLKGVAKSYPKSFKMQWVFDIVAHNAALMDARGHDIIVFYMQNESSHSKDTTRKPRVNCL